MTLPATRSSSSSPPADAGATLIQRKYPLAESIEGTDLYVTKHGFETAFASGVLKKVADQMWAEQRRSRRSGLSRR
jgi:hypothetical protein